MIFQSRTRAGEMLARAVLDLPLAQPIVLAIPRGGVPVGAAIAKALACPCDVIPLVKIQIPWNPEASYGVVAMDGAMAMNLPLVSSLELSEREVELAVRAVLDEAQQRNYRYRQGRPFPELRGRTVIITDDGLASGCSMLAALRFVNKRQPLGVIVASPVASDVARRMIHAEPGVDGLVLLAVDPDQFFTLASYYTEFPQLSDDEIVQAVSCR